MTIWQVHPNEARKGDFVDSFTKRPSAETIARLERILKNTGCNRELVLTYVLGKPRKGKPPPSWQLFLLP